MNPDFLACHQVYLYRQKFGFWVKSEQLAHNLALSCQVDFPTAEGFVERAVGAGYLKDTGGRLCLTMDGYNLIGEQPLAEVPSL